jgi:hypothetical protein
MPASGVRRPAENICRNCAGRMVSRPRGPDGAQGWLAEATGVEPLAYSVRIVHGVPRPGPQLKFATS